MRRISIPSLAKQVTTEAEAYEFMEGLRWPDGPVCPHCGATKAYFLTPKAPEGRTTRRGGVTERRVWKCAKCRKQFSVLTGTIFHGTKVPLRTWLFVIVEIVSSKNGVAAREIERKYELTPKTAWFMLHRLRAAMERADSFGELITGTVVADEAYVGGAERRRDSEVIDMETYLVETLAKMDRVIAELTADRHDISMRLAVIRATTTEAVQDAVREYEQRMESGEPYAGQDAATFLSEAHKRYGS